MRKFRVPNHTSLSREEAHKYQPVEVSGRFLETRIRVLVSQKLIGAGYRIIQPFQTADRVILIDRGFVKIDQTEDLRNDRQRFWAIYIGRMRWMNIPLNLT